MVRIVGAYGNAPAQKTTHKKEKKRRTKKAKNKKSEEQKKGFLFQGTLFRVIIEVSYRNLEQSS